VTLIFQKTKKKKQTKQKKEKKKRKKKREKKKSSEGGNGEKFAMRGLMWLTSDMGTSCREGESGISEPTGATICLYSGFASTRWPQEVAKA